MKIRLLFLFLLISGYNLFADNTIQLVNGITDYSLSKYYEVYSDSSGLLTIDSFLNVTKNYNFEALGKKSANFGLDSSVLWIKFTIYNRNNPENNWVLYIDWATLSEVQFYEIRKDTITTVVKNGIEYAYDTTKIRFKVPLIKIIVNSGDSVTYYVRIKSSSYKIILMKLYAVNKFIEQNDRYSFPLLILIGIIIGIMIYNLILWLITWERMYLFFALSMLAMFFNVMDNSGYNNEINYGLSVYWLLRLRFITYYLMSIFLFLYSIDYLETKKYFKIGHRIFIGVTIIFIVLLFLQILPFSNLYLINKIPTITYPTFAIIQFIVAIVVYYKGHRSAIYFILAYIFVLYGAIIHPLYLRDLVEDNFVYKSINLIVLSIYSVLLTAGLTEKVANLKKEKAKAKLLKIDNIELEKEINRRIKIQEELKMHKNNLEKIVQLRTLEVSENENKYKELIEQLYEWVWQIDENGIFIFCSKSSENVVGVNHKELIGNHFSLVYTDVQNKSIQEIIFEKKLPNNEFNNFESTYKCPDGAIKILETSGKKVYNQSGEFTGWRGLTKDITEKKNIEKRILSAVLETEEQERKRFSYELHDGLGASLSGINMYLNTINSGNISIDVKNDLLKNIHRLVKNAAAEVREIANNIRPYELSDLGLQVSIENMLERITYSQIFEVQLDFTEFTANLSKDTELVVFRVISELIANTIKHAKATKISILFKNNINSLYIIYTDDGIGFNYTEALKQNKGMGLRNILNRLNAIQGLMEILPSEKQGIKLMITIKIEQI